jgi:CysZ protein
MISRFLSGFRAPFAGFRLVLKNPTLWRLASIPYLIDLILFSAGVYWGWILIPEAMGKIVSTNSIWGQILYYPAMIFSMIAFIILLFCCVFFLTNLIASPFNTLLAEKTLVFTGRIETKGFAVSRWIKVSGRMLFVSLIRSVLFIAIGVILFAISLIPGLNLIAAFCGLLLMAFDCADFAFEALEINLKDRIKSYRIYLPEFSGFGCALGLTFLIPGLNLLLYPATVVGAALMVARFNRPQLKEPV